MDAEKRDMDPNVGGGVDRDKLEAGDFVFSDSRTFPVVTVGDVSDAVSSWGRYKGPHSFEEFKRRLIALCRRKGEAFVAALPAEWDVKALLITVKAMGDWELDVLGVPFGGPHAGRDAQGEYFSQATRTHEDKWQLPPVVYYHGFTPEGRPDGEARFIGKTVRRWTDIAGHWFRVVLDKTSEYAKRIWDAAVAGTARASSGSIAHLVRKASDGGILDWPVAELSLIDTGQGREPANAYAVAMPVMKTVYQQAGLTLPDEICQEAGAEGAQASPPAGNAKRSAKQTMEQTTMETQEIQKIVADSVAAALKAQADATAAETARKAQEQARIDEAVKAEKAKWEAEAAKARRLPYAQAPHVREFHDEKYDHLGAADMALMHQILTTHKARNWDPNNEDYLKSMANKAFSEEAKGSEAAHAGIKCLPIKTAGDIEGSTLSSYGDEWAGVMYSSALWEKIRAGSAIVSKIPTIEVPQGAETMQIPIEGTDPTWYKVAQASTLPTTEATGWPNATISNSNVGTPTNISITPAKLGARVMWTGEMDEDSMTPWLPTLRAQLEKSGAETMEYVCIDGDTATTASTNVNDIAGTPASTDAFLMVNGFRGLAIRINTAQLRTAGGLTVADYLETLKLMGDGGMNAADPEKVDFIIDPWVHWASLQLAEVQTRDVFSAATLERGLLTSVWGHRVHTSYQMCAAGVKLGTVTTAAYKFKSEVTGKVDQDTESDNLYGSILAVRFDQWKLGWKRRMTLETTRIARADVTEIVALCRFGLVYRDTEAAAISVGISL
ncbi:MAG TPA: hypothetical protein PK406_00655 [Verrucomicrobiota bacterium]|nr:hypothetical protein [Verrucomicrobiota bacterium]